MSLPIFDGFEVLSKQPIDNRYVCNNLADVKRTYDGLVTYQISDTSFYRRVGGSWKKDSFDIVDILNTSVNNLNATVFNDRLYNEKNSNNHVLGIEYLNYYHNKVRLNQAVKLIFSGDSTTYGTSIIDEKYKLNNLAKSFLEKNGVLVVDSINAGHESMNSSTWLSTYLDQDLAQNPDLYIIGWGFNWYGTLDNRLELYLNDLRVGLAKIRASKNANQMSIILRTPNSGGDNTNHRNTEWFDQIHPYLVQIARDYQCCFVDFHHYMYDSENVTWQDQYLYGAEMGEVHPLETANSNFISLMSEPLLPTAIRSGTVINQASTSITKLGTDTPSTYPFGDSIYRAMGSFPYDGLVKTSMSADGIAFQINSSYKADVNGYATRRGIRNTGTVGAIGNDAWAPWIFQGITEPPTTMTLLNSWVAYGTPKQPPRFFKDCSGIVCIEGMCKLGTFTTGTIIATLPIGYRRADGFFTVFTGSGVGTLSMDSSGNLKVLNIASNDWLTLEGIRFRAEL